VPGSRPSNLPPFLALDLANLFLDLFDLFRILRHPSSSPFASYTIILVHGSALVVPYFRFSAVSACGSFWSSALLSLPRSYVAPNPRPPEPRRALAPVHREPRLQTRSSPARRRERYVLHRRRRSPDSRRHCRPLVRQRRALPRIDHLRHPGTSGRDGLCAAF